MGAPKVQGRRVRRVLRKVDTWSVARMAFCLNLCLALVVVVAGVILWLGADGQGLIDKLEQTIRTNLQLETFEIHGDVLFRSVLLCAVLAAGLFTGLAVIGALLFNLLSDLVGGIQVWVLEEVVGDAPVYDQEDPPTDEQAALPFSGEIELESAAAAAAAKGTATADVNGNGHVESDKPEPAEPAGLPQR